MEIKGEQNELGLIKVLRSHFNEKDPGSVLQDLRHCVQLPGESAHEFCLRAMSLREKVACLSKEENSPFDAELLSTTFFKSIFTGLKQNNVRMELQQVLKECALSDERKDFPSLCRLERQTNTLINMDRVTQRRPRNRMETYIIVLNKVIQNLYILTDYDIIIHPSWSGII